MTKIKTISAAVILSVAVAAPAFAATHHVKNFRGAYDQMTTDQSFAVPSSGRAEYSELRLQRPRSVARWRLGSVAQSVRQLIWTTRAMGDTQDVSPITFRMIRIDARTGTCRPRRNFLWAAAFTGAPT